MLRNILLFIAVVATLTVPILAQCSKGCTCTESSAVCNTLDLKPFGMHILNLKIENPAVPLILKGQPFNVRGLQNLNSISISNATIVEIDKSAFTGIKYLSSFSILNANIPTVSDAKAFASVTNLRILTITNSTLNKFEFVSSHSLQELNLSKCKLITITKNSFENLPYLSYLNLSGNNISEIDPTAFSKLPYLQEVVLSDNRISSMDPDLFVGNTELETLDLSRNPLKTLNIKITSDLEKLVLQSLNLKHLDSKFASNVSMLSHLDLSDNRIDLNKTKFDKMTNLQYIDLSRNKLKSLDGHVFQYNSKLQKVILDHNNLISLPKFACKDDFFEIYYFSCVHCEIQTLPHNSFRHMPAMVILNLSHNNLNGNITSLLYLASLIELDLSYNNISALDRIVLYRSTGLEKLNLAGNPITSVAPSVFTNNRAIKSLDLSFCELQRIWQDEGKISSLLQLNVANNSISAISQSDLEVTPYLQVLDLSNNPLLCDEKLRDAITWLSKHDVAPANWLTHEALGKATRTKNATWKELAKERCADLFPDEEEIIDEKTVENSKSASNTPEISVDENEYDEEYEYDSEDYADDDLNLKTPKLLQKKKLSDDEFRVAELTLESTLHKDNRTHYSYLWPTIVFIFTALSVLVIAANVMLLLVRSRMIPRNVNLPPIRIPQWSNSKLKKHSGSVYQPLSEDKYEPPTPIVIRKDAVPTHMPKSQV